MAKSSENEVIKWAAAHELTDSTVQVLMEYGFTSLGLVSCLTPADIKEMFQTPKRLLPAQCLALRKAVAGLQKEQPTRAAPVLPPPARGQLPEVPTVPAEPPSPEDIASASSCPEPTRSQTRSKRTRNRETTEDSCGHAGVAKAASNIRAKYEQSSNTVLDSGAAADKSGQRRQREEFRFLLVGKTGSGKSTTGNTILGEDRFPTDLDFGSVTSVCQLERLTRHGITLEIMDSPGLFDTVRSQEDISTDIVKAVACMHPGPHAVLYVIRLGRYTEEEFEVYQRLKALFDDTLIKFMIVLFTGGDNLEGTGKTIADVLQSVPDELRQVLTECGNRYILFNNMADNKQPQVQQLFAQVRQLKAQTGDQYYTCPKYTEIAEQVEEEVTRRLAAVDRRQAERSRYVQDLRQQAQAAEQGVEREREMFAQRERERQQQMLEEQERVRQQMEQLVNQLKQQYADATKRQEEESRLRAELQMKLQEQMRAFASQREADRRRLEQQERELEVLRSKESEIQWNTEEDLEEERLEALRQIKDRVARDEEAHFVDRLKSVARRVVRTAKQFFTHATGRFV